MRAFLGKHGILLFLAIFFLASSAFSADLKYFSVFTYKQTGWRGSELSLAPEVRFSRDRGGLYYWQLRTGALFQPRDWLDLGGYLSLIGNKAGGGDWRTSWLFEFAFNPKVIIDFTHYLATAEVIPLPPAVRQRENQLTEKALDLLSYVELELQDFNWQDPAQSNLIAQVRPGISWRYRENQLYLRDDLYYSFKYGRFYREWLTLGMIRELGSIQGDFFYILEFDRPGYTGDWERANVFGTNFIWDNR